jgi:hypothetical protein
MLQRAERRDSRWNRRGKPVAEDIDVTYVSNQLQSRVQRNKAYWQLLVIREKELSDSLLQLPRT